MDGEWPQRPPSTLRISWFWEIVIEKGHHGHAVFQLLHGHVRMVLGPGTWTTSLPACAELITSRGNIFSYFRLHVRFFDVLKSVCHTAPGQPRYYMHSWWEGIGSLSHSLRRMHGDHPQHQLQDEICWPGGTRTHRWSWSCSVSPLWE